MLTLKCTLMELDKDGLWLVRLLRNERYATIHGANVRLDKFSSIPLRTTLDYETRFRKFDANGAPRKAPITEAQEIQLAQSLKFYGEYAEPGQHGCYSFSPIVEMYDQGNRHADSHYARRWQMSKAELDAIGMPRLNLSKPRESTEDAAQINRMGKFARWWVTFGGFDPIIPTDADEAICQVMTTALFGREAGAK